MIEEDFELESYRKRFIDFTRMVLRNPTVMKISSVSEKDFLNKNDYLCLRTLLLKPLTIDEITQKVKIKSNSVNDSLQRLENLDYI